MKISIFGSCIKNVRLVGVVTQNFCQHTHLAIPFHTSAPPQSKSHSYTYEVVLISGIKIYCQVLNKEYKGHVLTEIHH